MLSGNRYCKSETLGKERRKILRIQHQKLSLAYSEEEQYRNPFKDTERVKDDRYGFGIAQLSCKNENTRKIRKTLKMVKTKK